jgi:hypothetical protein
VGVRGEAEGEAEAEGVVATRDGDGNGDGEEDGTEFAFPPKASEEAIIAGVEDGGIRESEVGEGEGRDGEEEEEGDGSGDCRGDTSLLGVAPPMTSM